MYPSATDYQYIGVIQIAHITMVTYVTFDPSLSLIPHPVDYFKMVDVLNGNVHAKTGYFQVGISIAMVPHKFLPITQSHWLVE
jgi:hypothetical protein